MYSFMNAKEFINIAEKVPAWILCEDLNSVLSDAKRVRFSEDIQFSLCICGILLSVLDASYLHRFSVPSIITSFIFIILVYQIKDTVSKVRLHEHEVARLDEIRKLLEFSDTPDQLCRRDKGVAKSIFDVNLSMRAMEIITLEREINLLTGNEEEVNRHKDELRSQRDVLKDEFDQRFWVYKSLGVIDPQLKKQSFFGSVAVSN